MRKGFRPPRMRHRVKTTQNDLAPVTCPFCRKVYMAERILDPARNGDFKVCGSQGCLDSMRLLNEPAKDSEKGP